MDNQQTFQVFNARTFEVKEPREGQKRGDIIAVLETMPLDYNARKPRIFYIPFADLELYIWTTPPKDFKEFNRFMDNKILTLKTTTEYISIEDEKIL